MAAEAALAEDQEVAEALGEDPAAEALAAAREDQYTTDRITIITDRYSSSVQDDVTTAAVVDAWAE